MRHDPIHFSAPVALGWPWAPTGDAGAPGRWGETCVRKRFAQGQGREEAGGGGPGLTPPEGAGQAGERELGGRVGGASRAGARRGQVHSYLVQCERPWAAWNGCRAEFSAPGSFLTLIFISCSGFTFFFPFLHLHFLLFLIQRFFPLSPLQ